MNGLELGACLSQFVDLGLNLTQVSNDELMKMLIVQNKEYLEIIIEQNKQIIELLEVQNAKN